MDGFNTEMAPHGAAYNRRRDGTVMGMEMPAGIDNLRPLRVGVLVDLMLTPGAGGHVKCWQRVAEAATGFPERLDVTVHFNGPEPGRIELASNVRYELLPPVFSTARLVHNVPDHTDLGLWHKRLARVLPRYDVIHTTDAFFCYSRTATAYARRHGVPVVSSIHTNTPEYALITTEKLLERLLGQGGAYNVAVNMVGLPRIVHGILDRRLRRHLGHVTSAIGSDARHWGMSLRRGLDRTLFTPERRDRAWFERRFALPPGHLILMYAGKLNAGKNVPLLAPVVNAVRRAGVPVHLLCAGEGTERAQLEAALGPALTCAGTLDQAELARAYASADLFLFPSAIDESGNAPVEALACGLPALLAAGSGAATRMAACPGALILPGDQVGPWVGSIIELANAPRQRATMGEAARAFVEQHIPSWADVVAEDLLPLWQAAALQRG